MPDYRLYRLNDAGRIKGPPVVLTSSSDEEAIKEAQQYRDGSDMELWERSRRVASISKLGD